MFELTETLCGVVGIKQNKAGDVRMYFQCVAGYHSADPFRQ